MYKISTLVVLVLVSSIYCTNIHEQDALLKVLELSKCPFQVEPIGCHKDKFGFKKRALPDLILSGRDATSSVYQAPSIQWKNYHHWTANFICECAKRLFEKKPETSSAYIGMQFYGECWANLDKYLPGQYNRYGKSNSCIDSSFKNLTADNPSGYGLFTGKKLSNYVYKVSRFYRSCPEMQGKYISDGDQEELEITINDSPAISGKWKGSANGNKELNVRGHFYQECKGEITLAGRKYETVYNPETCKLILKGAFNLTKKICKKSILCPHYKSRGCWRDPLPSAVPSKRPMNTYAMNERDPRANNWNGRLINWRKWGRGYLAGLLCRCAKVAKQTKKRFFSIQFYGECWTSDNEDFMKYGKVTRCMDGNFQTCPLKDNMFRTNTCAGEWESNKVYEITQGIYKCESSPCLNDGECITNGPDKYKCICKPGFSGSHCQVIQYPQIDIDINK